MAIPVAPWSAPVDGYLGEVCTGFRSCSLSPELDGLLSYVQTQQVRVGRGAELMPIGSFPLVGPGGGRQLHILPITYGPSASLPLELYMSVGEFDGVFGLLEGSN